MKRLLSCLLLAAAASVSAEEFPPLTLDALSRCASQVQTLRSESERITRASAAMDQRRDAINERSAQLERERDQPTGDDLASGLEFQQRMIKHQTQVVMFNSEIESLRGEITALNALKFDYEQRCARRPYKRSDLEKLPQADQQAMRTGLNDVKVPYIDPESPPPR